MARSNSELAAKRRSVLNAVRNQKPEYIPTPEEIAAGTAAARAKWTPADYCRNLCYSYCQHYGIPYIAGVNAVFSFVEDDISHLQVADINVNVRRRRKRIPDSNLQDSEVWWEHL